jgi:hypothetical protein
MHGQAKYVTVRGAVLGVAIIGLAGALAGCTSGGVRGGSSLTAKPSAANFTITIDATDPADKQIDVTPDEGDVWLQAVATPGSGDNRVVWKSSSSFSIKFVQVDDQSKSPSKKFGDEGNGWNDSVRDGSGYKYKLTLKNGSTSKKKSIQGAKYLVKIPAGCDDSSPGPSCLVLDPIIIVRY